MIKIEKEANAEIASFEIDTLNALVAEDIKNEISALFENGTTTLIVDLKGVKYIDSSGFGCLLSISKSAKNNFGTIRFCSIEPEVMKVLEMLHLHKVLHISSSRAECLALL